MVFTEIIAERKLPMDWMMLISNWFQVSGKAFTCNVMSNGELFSGATANLDYKVLKFVNYSVFLDINYACKSRILKFFDKHGNHSFIQIFS